MRIAPSSLMTSPLIMGFSASDVTRWANSAGSPRREGKGTWRARKERTFSGRLARRGVENRPAWTEKYKEIKIEPTTFLLRGDSADLSLVTTIKFCALTRRYGEDSDAHGSQVSCYGKSHSHDASFGGRVRSLAHLKRRIQMVCVCV